MPHPGGATPEGTASYREAFSGKIDPAHFRELNGLWMSSVGIGTYLGEADAATDAAYRDSVAAAVRSGINVVDTAINYRFQRSERSIAAALDGLIAAGEARRDQLILSTKGGFIPFDGAAPASQEELMAYMNETYFGPGLCAPADIAANCHCMTPAYLRHELERSLANLGVEKVDIYYLHNPETQLQAVARPVFLERLRTAFGEFERMVAEGKIGCYGTATWNGYRARPGADEYLSLDEVWAAAEAAGGKAHHFRVVQLPMNLGMTEAFSLPNQRSRGEEVSFLAAAARRGLTVMASGSILQGAAARGLPPLLGEVFPGFRMDAQRAIQFTRSTPGVGVALVGMRQLGHVKENAEVACRPPVDFDTFMKLFRRE
ncbi:MAG: aldo/keto reductase [bacterium]|nr:aldo/keto reductase [bacterium]